MARIVKRKSKRGVSYQAAIRRKGFDTVARTFDTKGEAITWATVVEQDMKDPAVSKSAKSHEYHSGQALKKYLATISSQKAINTQMLEENVARRLLERIGAQTSLGSVSS